jgi:predicted ATP-grasp superfamily ATP-dependent carboligase
MVNTSAHRPTALVTDSGRGSALAFIRSLGRRGWRVIAADSYAPNPGFRSRFASDRLLYPVPAQDPAGLVDAVLECARREAVDLVIPVTDDVILPLSDARDRFDGVAKLAIPDLEALATACDKHRTVELARSLGVPVPRTLLVRTADEARRAAAGLGSPVIVKPRFSRRYRDHASVESFSVSYAEDSEEAARRVAALEGRCDVLLQAHCAGVGHGVELLLFEGRPLAAFQHMRLRELPIHGGASAYRTSVPLDPELYGHATRLLAALRWTGLAMVEFKVGAQGPWLMEINGRVWGSLPLAVHSGVDFPAQLADLMMHGPPPGQPEPPTSYPSGIRSRNLELDLMWIVSVLLGRVRYPAVTSVRKRDALRALGGLFNPRSKFDILSVSDPLPGMTEISKIVGKFRGKISSPAADRHGLHRRSWLHS